MERSQSWCDFSARYETGSDSEEEKKEDGEDREEEEDPYTFAEIDDSEYDTILASRSIKKKVGSRSFIMNRPPAPNPSYQATFSHLVIQKCKLDIWHGHSLAS